MLLDDDNMIYIVHVFKVVMSHPLDITRNHQFNAGLKEGSKRCNNSENSHYLRAKLKIVDCCRVLEQGAGWMRIPSGSTYTWFGYA